MRAKTKIMLTISLMLAALSLAVAAEMKGTPIVPGTVHVERFIDPTMCGECHSLIFDEWKGSMHSLALEDPVYQALAKHFYKNATSDLARREGEMCIKCHAPAAFAGNLMTNPGQPFATATESKVNGIFCDYCHTVSGLKETKNTGHLIDPGESEDNMGVKRGPRGDGHSEMHGLEFSTLHTEARFCGGCHNVTHVVLETPLETTYTEWEQGPYYTGDPATTITCQDCHMRQALGTPATAKTARPDRPGKSAEDGMDRPHVWRHSIVGANTFLPGGDRPQMARERLLNAASLEVTANEDDGLVRVRVKVINDGAGHYLPTGVTELRQMWLEVVANDPNGKTVFSSGVQLKNGALPDDTVLYHMALGDANGQPTLDITTADRVLHDYRIAPGGFRLETYTFAAPTKTKKLNVAVRLRYRSLPQKVLDMLGDAAPKVEIIDMVAAKTELKL